VSSTRKSSRELLPADPLQRGEIVCTSFHITGAETPAYSWRSTLPIPATFAQGLAGCRPLSSSVKRRLASETMRQPKGLDNYIYNYIIRVHG
jgi:hypothetical protein